MKKKILFVIDIPDWAYHNIAKEISKTIESEYDTYFTICKDYPIRKNNSTPFFTFIFNLYANFVFYFYRLIGRNEKVNFLKKHTSYLKPTQNWVQEVLTNKKVKQTDFDYIFDMAYYFQYTFELPFQARKRWVGLYTDSFPHEGNSFDLKNNRDVSKLNREDFFKNYIQPYDGLIVGSQNLYDNYKKFNHPMALVNAIYKMDEFEENKTIGENEYLTIGWTGNPNRTMKGFKEIIEPAVNNLIKKGFNLRLKTRFSGDYEGLLSFYKDIDLICIASTADTGPSLFAEASLSNVPAISTKIGFPEMIIRDGENGVFAERNIADFEAKITELYYDRKLLKKMSNTIKNDYLEKLDNKQLINNFVTLLKSQN